MSKTKIEFTRENKDYTLEFTADSLKKMEKRGVNFSTIQDNVVNAPTELFSGLFIEHHDDVPEDLRVEIFHELTEVEDGEALETVMVDMLGEAIEELRQHKGNVKWRVRK